MGDVRRKAFSSIIEMMGHDALFTGDQQILRGALLDFGVKGSELSITLDVLRDYGGFLKGCYLGENDASEDDLENMIADEVYSKVAVSNLLNDLFNTSIKPHFEVQESNVKKIPKNLVKYKIPDYVTSIKYNPLVSDNRSPLISIDGHISSEFLASIECIIVPDSVIEVDGTTFSGCDSLISIEVSSGNMEYSSVDGVLFNKDGTKLIKYPNAREGTYSIPKSVVKIDDEAFWECRFLSSIFISDSVTEIWIDQFSGCTSLASIEVSSGNMEYSSVDGVLFNKDETELIACPCAREGASYSIPKSVIEVGNSAFFNCTLLKSIIIPDSIIVIEPWAFYGCTSLESVIIPNSVTKIGSWAFCGCASLTSIFISESVIEVGNSAFFDCISLESVIIPNSVTKIGSSAFHGCTSLKTISIPDSAIEIGDYAFDSHTIIHRSSKKKKI